MPTLEELSARRQRLSTVWERLVADEYAREGSTGPAREGLVSAGAPRPRTDLPTLPDGMLLESWRRSAEWVDPEVAAAPVDAADEAVTQWRSSPVAAGVRAAAEDVRRVADDGDLVAAVTDATGRIVWTYGSRVMQRAAERVNFVPGGRWDEISVGTNALALALRTDAPSVVYSAEHFSRAVHGWVCYSVPLHDPATGSVLGVLDLSTTWDRAHPLVMGTAQVLGRLVTANMPVAGAPLGSEPGSTLDLRVLGDWHVRLDNRPLALPHRQVEILLLLALHPAGLSLELLHALLYGDSAVSSATLKAEVSHLRAALGGGIGSRPYRLTYGVDSDAQRVLRALDRGDVEQAVLGYGGPLLAESESPDLTEWRDYLDVALRTAVLRSADVPTVLRLADAHPYDLSIQEHLRAILPAGDPRVAAVAARVHRASQ